METYTTNYMETRLHKVFTLVQIDLSSQSWSVHIQIAFDFRQIFSLFYPFSPCLNEQEYSAVFTCSYFVFKQQITLIIGKVFKYRREMVTGRVSQHLAPESQRARVKQIFVNTQHDQPAQQAFPRRLGTFVPSGPLEVSCCHLLHTHLGETDIQECCIINLRITKKKKRSGVYFYDDTIMYILFVVHSRNKIE